MASSKFIGKGIIFPIQLNSSGRPDSIESIELIMSSIKMILNWPVNVRFFNETFGGRIHEMLEEPNDNITHSLMRTFVKEALDKHEKRIHVLDTTIESYDLAKVNVKINFRIRNTKIEETMIFPFYKTIS